jgi:hypothetical protein
LDMRRGDASADSLDLFGHVSLHAPLMIYDRRERSVEVLRRLVHLQQNNFDRGVDLVVFHPDTITDFSVIARTPFYERSVAFENMDSRKQSFKGFEGIEEMRYLLRFFPDFKMCLDVNYALDSDPRSLSPDPLYPCNSLADQFLKSLGSRIKQVHLSGHDNNGHALLFKTRQNQLIKQAFDANAPIIIESVVGTLEEMKQEHKYVLKILSTLKKLQAGERNIFRVFLN